MSKYNWDVQDALVASLHYRVQQDSVNRANAQWVLARQDSVMRDIQQRAGQPVESEGYVLLQRQGPDVFAYIAPVFARDTSRVHQFGSNLCGGNRPCTVRFWTTRKTKTFTLPLPPELQATQVAEYSQGISAGADRVSLLLSHP